MAGIIENRLNFAGQVSLLEPSGNAANDFQPEYFAQSFWPFQIFQLFLDLSSLETPIFGSPLPVSLLISRPAAVGTAGILIV